MMAESWNCGMNKGCHCQAMAQYTNVCSNEQARKIIGNCVSYMAIARQRLGKHAAVATDTHTTIDEILGSGVFYVICAEVI
jgi:hypothetical protein